MNSAMPWLISGCRAVAPPSGQLLNAAYAVRLARGGSTRNVVVEFADVSTVASNGYAEEVARRFVCNLEPPRHLVVQRSGSVEIVAGPPEAPSERPDVLASNVTQAPRRARSHRRGVS
jgi:hypothetical protein